MVRSRPLLFLPLEKYSFYPSHIHHLAKKKKPRRKGRMLRRKKMKVE
ncbi:hypothetical protein J7J12_00175 [bacterium]|nr:hypothetical protein [bacterium]